MKLNQSLVSFSLLALAALPMQARERLNFDEGWLFTLADSVGMEKNDYADLTWRHLDLPHDWAIEGDFSPTNPSGASGGALPGASVGIASTSPSVRRINMTSMPSPLMVCI